MQECGAEKQNQDFTNMNKFIIISFIVVLFSCQKSNQVNDDPIPDVPVSITINLALPLYAHLETIGTHVYEPGGVKGVVVVHHTDDKYYAFDRTCSYQQSTNCAKIEVDSTNLQFRCGKTISSGFEKCCDSRFFMDGMVAQGPAKFGLKQYNVSKNGTMLNIFN